MSRINRRGFFGVISAAIAGAKAKLWGRHPIDATPMPDPYLICPHCGSEGWIRRDASPERHLAVETAWFECVDCRFVLQIAIFATEPGFPVSLPYEEGYL